MSRNDATVNPSMPVKASLHQEVHGAVRVFPIGSGCTIACEDKVYLYLYTREDVEGLRDMLNEHLEHVTDE